MESTDSTHLWAPPPLFSRLEALDPTRARCARCDAILVRVGGGLPRCAVAAEHPIAVGSEAAP